MKPENFAKKIFNDYYNIVKDKDKTIECVFMCIKNIETMNAYSSEYLYNIKYWDDVKNELYKL